jgi:hypothetical protein
MIIPRRFCSYCASSLIHSTDLRRCLTTPLVHDQGHGGRRWISERARGASDRDGTGAGLRALLLVAATATAAIASSSATRWKQERQQKQSEHRSRQCELGVLSPAASGANSASAGSAAIRRKRKRHDLAYHRPALYGERLAALGVVEIVITTAVELLPGATVTGFGLKLHSAEITGVLEQDKVTALANEAPTGSTLKL